MCDAAPRKGAASPPAVSLLHQADIVPVREGFLRNGEGAMIAGAQGDLLAVFTRFYGGTHDHSAADIWAMRSADAGLSWSDPQPVIENTSGQNTMSVSLHLRDSGEVLAIVLEKHSDRSCFPVIYSSDDCGDSFRRIGPALEGEQPYVCAHNDRIVRTGGGRLFLPLFWKTDAGYTDAQRSSTAYKSSNRATCMWSDDDGQTWTRCGQDLSLPKRGAGEPAIVELSSGDLMMTVRTQLGSIYRAHSGDGGASWSELESMGVTSPEAPHAMGRRAGDRRLYLVHCPTFVPDVHHFGPRYPLLFSYSEDEGRSWHRALEIESGPEREFANTSMLFCGSRVYLTYYARHLDRANERFNCKDLRLAILEISDGE